MPSGTPKAFATPRSAIAAVKVCSAKTTLIPCSSSSATICASRSARFDKLRGQLVGHVGLAVRNRMPFELSDANHLEYTCCGLQPEPSRDLGCGGTSTVLEHLGLGAKPHRKQVLEQPAAKGQPRRLRVLHRQRSLAAQANDQPFCLELRKGRSDRDAPHTELACKLAFSWHRKSTGIVPVLDPLPQGKADLVIARRRRREACLRKSHEQSNQKCCTELILSVRDWDLTLRSCQWNLVVLSWRLNCRAEHLFPGQVGDEHALAARVGGWLATGDVGGMLIGPMRLNESFIACASTQWNLGRSSSTGSAPCLIMAHCRVLVVLIKSGEPFFGPKVCPFGVRTSVPLPCECQLSLPAGRPGVVLLEGHGLAHREGSTGQPL